MLRHAVVIASWQKNTQTRLLGRCTLSWHAMQRARHVAGKAREDRRDAEIAHAGEHGDGEGRAALAGARDSAVFARGSSSSFAGYFESNASTLASAREDVPSFSTIDFFTRLSSSAVDNAFLSAAFKSSFKPSRSRAAAASRKASCRLPNKRTGPPH